MFQSLNPFSTSSRSLQSTRSLKARNEEVLRAFFAAAHTDSELVKIIAQLQASSFREPSAIQGRYQRAKETAVVGGDGSPPPPEQSPDAAASRENLTRSSGPGGDVDGSQVEDDEDVFGMEDGGVVVDEYVDEAMRSRAQSAISLGSIGQHRQRLASWDEFGSEAAGFGDELPTLQDDVTEQADAGRDSEAISDETPRTPATDADGAVEDDGDNAFHEESEFGDAPSDEEVNIDAVVDDEDGEEDGEELDDGGEIPDPNSTAQAGTAPAEARSRLSSDVADEFGDGGDAPDAFGIVDEDDDADGDHSEAGANAEEDGEADANAEVDVDVDASEDEEADADTSANANPDTSTGTGASISAHKDAASSVEDDDSTSNAVAVVNADDEAATTVVEPVGDDHSAQPTATTTTTTTTTSEAVVMAAKTTTVTTTTTAGIPTEWEFAKSNLPTAWKLCSSAFAGEIRALRARVYDLEHLLHDECTRRAEADALTEAANARAAKATELLHEMLAKDAIDAQQAASDDPEVQQEFKTAQVSAQLAEALEATELQLSTAHAKTVRREDELAVAKMDLLLEQQRVATVANMLRTVGNAASSVEKALIKADSLKAATVVTAAKARAIKDFCELQKTLQSSQSVRESLMDQAATRQKTLADKEAQRVANKEAFLSGAAVPGRERSMTMEEGTVRQLETTDVTHEEESDDEDEVDLVMKRLKRLVKGEGIISYSRLKLQLIEEFGESAFAGRKVQIQSWLESRTVPKEKPPALTLEQQQQRLLSQERRRHERAIEAQEIAERIRLEEVREEQEAAEAARRATQPRTRQELKQFFDSVKIGDKVRLKGLKANREYNNQIGEVLSKTRINKRFRLKLISTPALFGRTVVIPAQKCDKITGTQVLSTENLSCASEIARAMEAVAPPPKQNLQAGLQGLLKIGRKKADSRNRKSKTQKGKKKEPLKSSPAKWKTLSMNFSAAEPLGLSLKSVHAKDHRSQVATIPKGQAKALGIQKGDIIVAVAGMHLGPGESAVDFLRKAMLDVKSGKTSDPFPVVVVRGGPFGVAEYDAMRKLAVEQTRNAASRAQKSASPSSAQDDTKDDAGAPAAKEEPGDTSSATPHDDDLDDADAFLAESQDSPNDKEEASVAPPDDDPKSSEESEEDQQIAIDEDDSDSSSSLGDDEYAL